LIAASIVLGRQYPTLNLRGLESTGARWEMQRFELVRVVIPAEGVNALFYVAKHTRTWRKQNMTLELESIEPKAPPT
jgi:hypothetical protein